MTMILIIYYKILILFLDTFTVLSGSHNKQILAARWHLHRISFWGRVFCKSTEYLGIKTCFQ